MGYKALGFVPIHEYKQPLLMQPCVCVSIRFHTQKRMERQTKTPKAKAFPERVETENQWTKLWIL